MSHPKPAAAYFADVKVGIRIPRIVVCGGRWRCAPVTVSDPL